MAIIKNTSDGRKIGIEIIEISSFPSIEMSDSIRMNYNSAALEFLHLIKEFRAVYSDDRASFEILWVTHPVDGQIYESEIKIYLLLREIGNNENAITSHLQLLAENFCSLLKVNGYTLRICNDVEEVKGKLVFVDNECILALKKREKFAISSSVQSVLYYNDVLEKEDYGSFDNLVSRLSELKDCAVSFQIFPSQMGFQDQVIMSEMVNLYHNIANGRISGGLAGGEATLREPLKFIDSYYESLQNGLFNYNILILGKRGSAESLVSRICGMLKCEENKQADFDVIEFKNYKIKLYGDIFIYPWNANKYIQNVINGMACTNNSQAIVRKLSLMMSDRELLNFFRLPLYSKNALALKYDDIFNITEEIDDSLLAPDNIKLGAVNTVNGKLELGCPKEQFAKHALIVGTPGTGKTTFSLNLLLQFHKQNVPFLAIEPTKTEYRALIEKIPDLQIFTPGNNEISPFIINPFIPPKGIKVEQYIPALISAFGAAFSMASPLDVIFLKAIRTAYTEYGWKDYSKFGDNDVKEFGLYEFILVFKRIIRESNYGREVKGNLETGGTFRLMNLIEQNGNIYDTVKNIPIEDILTKPTVLELNAIQGESEKALIMALLLSSICLYTKLIQRGDGKLKNILLIDEAHVLLGGAPTGNDEQSNPKGTTIDSLKAMIAEIRSYGTGIIIADQSAKKVSREIVANTDIKVAFRLVEKEEKEILGNSVNADERIKNHMSKLKMGEAFMFFSKLEEPQLIVTPDIRKVEHINLVVPDESIASKMQYWGSHKDLLMPFRECKYCDKCREGCNYYIRSDANYHAARIYSSKFDKIIDKAEFIRHLKGVNVLLKSALETYEEEKREQMIQCCTIQLRRKIQLETNLLLTEKEMKIIMDAGRENYE